MGRTIKASKADNGVIEVANLYEAGMKGYNRMNGQICSTQGSSGTIRANSGGHNEVKIAEENHTVRKLTPRECWRLMGFSDEDFDKAAAVNSNSQLYKQAGNSIVVDVLMAIFGQIKFEEE